MNVKRIPKTSVQFLLAVFSAALGVCAIAGCSSNQAVASSDYQKLPPGEGARRLQDTLKRRAAGKARAAPLPAGVRVDQQQ